MGKTKLVIDDEINVAEEQSWALADRVLYRKVLHVSTILHVSASHSLTEPLVRSWLEQVLPIQWTTCTYVV